MKKILVVLTLLCAFMAVTACSKTDAQQEVNKENNETGVSEKDTTVDKDVEETDRETEKDEVDSTASASIVDGSTSASIVPDELVQKYVPKGFTDSDKKKALFVVGDPRKNSVNYDLVNTAMQHFEENDVEVELRDLYDLKFNPVIQPEEFYYAKDGAGDTPKEIKVEQEFITKADYIIFCYPNWHDTPNAIVKGYMEKVFAKKFAYHDTENGLEGLLGGKSIYTIMNAGFLGGGRGYIDNGVGINDEAWNEYMHAFEVFDNDTAGFWGLENKGRFVNDRTPKNTSENYDVEINELRDALKTELDKVYFQ